RAARLPRAGTVARPDVPTCRLDEPLGAVRERVRAAGWDVCVVVNEERVVLGLLRAGELEAPAERTVEEVMRPGPSTFRPNVPIGEMAEFMRRHDLPSAPVTTSAGRLVGLLFREDAERAAAELAAGRDPFGQGRSVQDPSGRDTPGWDPSGRDTPGWDPSGRDTPGGDPSQGRPA
ncbi:MAG TPA: CBS domain-containing protein, partial [Actinomycetota bacterium]|nr:CBS domain-containing protein [Actinomycetota bacterium]